MDFDDSFANQNNHKSQIYIFFPLWQALITTSTFVKKKLCSFSFHSVISVIDEFFHCLTTTFCFLFFPCLWLFLLETKHSGKLLSAVFKIVYINMCFIHISRFTMVVLPVEEWFLRAFRGKTDFSLDMEECHHIR